MFLSIHLLVYIYIESILLALQHFGVIVLVPVWIEHLGFREEGVVAVDGTEHDPDHPALPEGDAIYFTVLRTRAR